jgi:hypothetical protein
MAGLGPAQKERTGLLPMNSLRYLMQALAVVIVMIAAVALPSGAYAHAGHAHGQQVSAAAETVETVAYVPTGLTVSAELSSRASELVVAQPGQKPTSARCSGLCCGISMCFCAPGVVRDVLAMKSPMGSAETIAWPTAGTRPSISPEALPEPPRSFA